MFEKIKKLFSKEKEVSNVNFNSISKEDSIKIKQTSQIIIQKEKEKKIFLIKTPQETILNVKYNSQRDNLLSPSSACNVTSLAMAISPYFTKEYENKLIAKFDTARFHSKIYNTIAKKGYSNLNLDDKLFSAINSLEFQNFMINKYPREIWMQPYFHKCAGNELFASLVEIVNFILEDSRYATMNKKLSLDLIMKEINEGYPVIICGKFTGGHFVTVVGYNLTKNVLIIHDPWGDWNTKYANKNGEFVGYSIPKLFSQGFLFSMPILVHFDKRISV